LLKRQIRDIIGGISIMREIKFRAWHKSRCEMLPIIDIEYLMTKGALVTDYKDFVENIYPNIMQYTGVVDNDNLEIFEGDIVNIQAGSFYQGYYEIDEIFEVCYDKYGFFLKNKDYKENFWIAEKIYVIGNIYENKELLN
jgi:uncharacterized phage protein (TIGR01671 family)